MPEHIFNCMQYAHAVAQCYNVTGCICCNVIGYICNVTILQCYNVTMLQVAYAAQWGPSDEQTFVRVAHFSYFFCTQHIREDNMTRQQGFSALGCSLPRPILVEFSYMYWSLVQFAAYADTG